MSSEEATATPTTVSAKDAPEKVKAAVDSLSSIVPSLSSTTSSFLFSNSEIYSNISALLRRPNSGSGDNNLCRWLYDTFQSGVSDLQLLVLRFLPVIAGVYLSRVADRKPQAGFEAVLLALYAHETTSRAGKAVFVTIPDLTQPNVYTSSSQESKTPNNKNNNSTEPNVVVVSPSLEPHGTVRSTRRARIVGVALELFFKKISHMPVSSKIDFCEFCKLWAGQDGDMYVNFEEESVVESDAEAELDKKVKKLEGRVPLAWELLEPILRILGHCLLGGPTPNLKHNKNKKNKEVVELFNAASEACRCLFARSMHDVNPKAILSMRSLLRLSKSLMANDPDPTDLTFTDVVSL